MANKYDSFVDERPKLANAIHWSSGSYTPAPGAFGFLCAEYARESLDWLLCEVLHDPVHRDESGRE